MGPIRRHRARSTATSTTPGVLGVRPQGDHRKYLPQNEGIMKPMTVRAPEGSFLNPQPPTAANARPIINQRLVELNLGAVAKAVPDKVIAASSHFGNPNFSGRIRRPASSSSSMTS
ncbi:hypothetical protein D8S78_23465 [Natrialba swarupiae]|nr:hypothetical protein [Natrialba swarupiae]